MKKLIASLLTAAMLAASTAAFAAAPTEYDGKPYPAGVETNDPDGVMNLAVIASDDVMIYGDAMYIEGSVYSGGTIYGGNGAGNVIKGVFISGTENQTETGYDLEVIRHGYVHVDDDGNVDVTNAYSTGLEHEGAILDKQAANDVQGVYSYTPYDYDSVAASISNKVEGEVTANQYTREGELVVSQDTHFETMAITNAGLIIDASAGDVTVAIDKVIVGSNPYIRTIGDGHVNLDVKEWDQNGGTVINTGLMHVKDINAWAAPDQVAYNQTNIYQMDGNGIPRPNEAIISELDPSKIDFYVNTASGVVSFQGAKIAANVHTNASELTFGYSLDLYGNIESGAEKFETIGAGYVNGKVFVPNAASIVHNSSCIQGQLITKTLLINGAGSILNGTDSLSDGGNDNNDDKNIHLNIVEDVVYVVIGSADKPKLTLDQNTNYKITTDTNNVWFSSNSKGENVWYPGYLTANDVTFDYTAADWAIKPGDVVIVTATSVEDETVTDTAKIGFVASEDDIPKPTPEPTPSPLPEDEEIDLKGAGYAYIFGYEPEIVTETVTDAEGNVVEEIHKANIYMGPNDLVSREQVAAMIMRMIDQAYDTTGVSYPVTDNMAQHAGTWYERGLAYLASKGAFDGVSEVKIGGVTRGEVAKLVACGLNLTKTTDVAFEDIAGSEYAEYIKIMNAYGFMQGMDATHFVPDEFMTRAQFCSMFNQIIGRNEMGLEAQDGTIVTPALYSIVDLDGHWAADIMLKATSAYDQNGLIDVETRLANIRNTLDNYDAQKWF